MSNDNIAVMSITFMVTSGIWLLLLGVITEKWRIWAIKVGKARYNQITGILEFDEIDNLHP